MRKQRNIPKYIFMVTSFIRKEYIIRKTARSIRLSDILYFQKNNLTAISLLHKSL